MFPRVHSAWRVDIGLQGSKGMSGGGPGGDGWCGGSGGGEKLQPELRCADGMLVSRERRGLSGDI